MEKFNELIQAHFGQLSNQELGVIRSYFKEERLQKADFYTKSEKICNKLSIVTSGILRVFALHDGKEITQWISTENYLITEVMGFFFDQPNRWTIQALTDTELLTITKEDYRLLCKEVPKWNEVEKCLLMKCFAMIEDRIFSHLSMSSAERYDLYFRNNKALFNQVPLQFIASVLGMTAETFSRIRKRQNEKS